MSSKAMGGGQDSTNPDRPWLELSDHTGNHGTLKSWLCINRYRKYMTIKVYEVVHPVTNYLI